MTGTRRRYSEVRLPERIAQAFGLDEDEAKIRIEHIDEGMSSTEVSFWSAFYDLQAKETK